MASRGTKPNAHVILVVALTVVWGVAWLLGPAPAEQQANAAMVTPEPMAGRPAAPPPGPGQPPAALPSDAAPSAPTTASTAAPVRPGDSLSRIFQRHGLSPGDLQRVLDSGPQGKRLKSIFPGHTFEFDQDEHGNLIHLTYRPGRLEWVEFRRVGDRFEAEAVVREPDIVQTYTSGIIKHSLFAACQRAGLDDAFATRLAELFQWDVDFILDIREGDAFHVLYEKHFIDGQFIRNGAILAAEFVNVGTSHRAVRFEDGYYAPNGDSMRKAFLRAPLNFTPVNFTRISSNFNLKRLHPLWKRTMPHLGIDYAAPTGTPIKAVGDGRVVTASRNNASGRYVVLQHGQRYRTKYLHMSRFARGMKAGKSVQQGEVIGYVGATGWATGPHLHYEFLVDGVHKNPRTVSLPKATPIPVDDRAAFDAATGSLLAALDRYRSASQIAQADTQR